MIGPNGLVGLEPPGIGCSYGRRLRIQDPGLSQVCSDNH